jgi:hypothetical protein
VIFSHVQNGKEKRFPKEPKIFARYLSLFLSFRSENNVKKKRKKPWKKEKIFIFSLCQNRFPPFFPKRLPNRKEKKKKKKLKNKAKTIKDSYLQGFFFFPERKKKQGFLLFFSFFFMHVIHNFPGQHRSTLMTRKKEETNTGKKKRKKETKPHLEKKAFISNIKNQEKYSPHPLHTF